MADITVSTKEELKAAIKNKADNIIIADAELAKHVRAFMRIKKLSKWTLILLLSGTGIGAAGLALAPATGGTSAVAGGAVATVMYSITTAGGTVISIEAIIAIGIFTVLGVHLLLEFWKSYDVVEANGTVDPLGKKIAGSMKLSRKK